MKRIFLSYNFDYDRTLVDRLVQLLEESSRFEVLGSGFSDFSDDHPSQVRSQIQKANMLMALFRTPSSNVLLETGIALGLGKPVIIVGGGSEILPIDLLSLPYVQISGDAEVDLSVILQRLDSSEFEDEQPPAIYHTFKDKLCTYKYDPDYFESISPSEFEELIKQIFQEHGFKTSVVNRSRDSGIDIVAYSPIDQTPVVIETKKFSRQSRVSMKEVMSLLGVASLLKAQTAVLVTSSRFTRAALEMAAECQNPKLRLLTMDEILQSQNLTDLVQ